MPLCLAADHFRADRLSVLTVAADIRCVAERVLTCARAAHRLIVRCASVSRGHDDLAAIKGGIQLFELLDQLITDKRFMLFAALTAELFCIKMRGELRGIIEFIFLDHNSFLSAKNRLF